MSEQEPNARTTVRISSNKSTLKDKITKNLTPEVIVVSIFLLIVGFVAYNRYANRAGLYKVEACLMGAGDKSGKTYTDPTDGKVTEFRNDICRELEANTDLATYVKLWLPSGNTVNITCDEADDLTGQNCFDEDDNVWTLKKIKRLGDER